MLLWLGWTWLDFLLLVLLFLFFKLFDLLRPRSFMNAKKTKAVVYNQDPSQTLTSKAGDPIEIVPDFVYGAWVDSSAVIRDTKIRRARAWSAWHCEQYSKRLRYCQPSWLFICVISLVCLHVPLPFVWSPSQRPSISFFLKYFSGFVLIARTRDSGQRILYFCILMLGISGISVS